MRIIFLIREKEREKPQILEIFISFNLLVAGWYVTLLNYQKLMGFFLILIFNLKSIIMAI